MRRRVVGGGFFIFLVALSVLALPVYAGVCLNPALTGSFCQETDKTECCSGATEAQCAAYYYEDAAKIPNVCYLVGSEETKNQPVCLDTCRGTYGDTVGQYASQLLCQGEYGIGWDFLSGAAGKAKCGEKVCVQCGDESSYVYPVDVGKSPKCALFGISGVKKGLEYDQCMSEFNPQGGSFTVSGVVLDKNKNTPLANAFVSAFGASTKTDSDGKFVLKGLYEGTYDLIVALQGYDPGSLQVTLGENNPVLENQQIFLEKTSLTTLKVIVRDGSGLLLSNALVTVTAKDDSYSFTLLTEGGYATFVGLQPGEYSITGSFGTLEKEEDVTITQGFNQKEMKLAVEIKKGSISGKVMNAQDKKPLDGVTVSVVNAVLPQAITNENGGYVIPNVVVQSTPYTVRAVKNGFTVEEKAILVTDAKEFADVDFALTPVAATQTTLIVKIKNTEPVDGVTIKVFQQGALFQEKKTINKIATFTLNQFAGYTIVAEKAGYDATEAVISALPANHVEEMLLGKATAALSGVIKKKQNNKEVPLTKDEIKKIKVYLVKLSTGEVSSLEGNKNQLQTGEMGGYLFQDISSGKYQLSIIDEQGVYQQQHGIVTLKSFGKQTKLIVLEPFDCSSSIKEPTVDDVTAVPGENVVDVAYTLSCKPSQATVYVCGGKDDCNPAEPVWTLVSDIIPTDALVKVPVPPNKKICYKIKAHYPLQGWKESAFNEETSCIQTGDAYCFTKYDTEFCASKTKTFVGPDKKPTPYYGWMCDEMNVLKMKEKPKESKDLETCSSEDDFKVVSGDLDSPKCKYKCRQTLADDTKVEYYDTTAINCKTSCNSVFGIFGGSTEGFLTLNLFKQTNCFTDWLTGTTLEQFCYYDYTKKSVDMFEDCSQIASCYDFKSEDACVTHPKCGYKTKCDWNPSSHFASLGVGVCMPKNQLKQDCTLCSAGTKYNALLSDCLPEDSWNLDYTNEQKEYLLTVSEDHCTLFGDCYFANTYQYDYEGNPEPYPVKQGCLNRAETVCEDAKDEEDCIGVSKESVQIHIEYDNFGLGVSGDNVVLKNSSGDVGKGLCAWDASLVGQPRCFKERDGNKKPDCEGQGQECYQDTKEPYTFAFTQPVVKEFVFPVNVFTDETKTALEEGPYWTYFTYARKPDPVPYPSQELKHEAIDGEIVVSIQQEENLIDAEYTFNYYSVDKHNNIEQIKEFTVALDTTPPEIMVSYDPDLFKNASTFVFTITSNEDVRCTGSLKGWFFTNITGEEGDVSSVSVDGAAVPPSFPDTAEITPATAFTFKEENSEYTVSKTYAAVQDGIYTYTVSGCSDALGNVAPDQTIYVATGDSSQIFNEQPFGKININANIPLSVNTFTDAECKYKELNPGDKPTFDMTFLSTMKSFSSSLAPDGSYLHTAFEQYDGTYTNPFLQYAVWCTLPKELCPESEAMCAASEPAGIIFGIDMVAPVTMVYAGKSVPTIKTVFDKNKWHKETTIKLGCDDPLLPKSPSFVYGCDHIAYCETEGVSCDPGTSLALSLALSSGLTEQLAFFESKTACFSSVDTGNNTEQMQCLPIKIDTHPPKVEAQMNLNPLTNATNTPFVTVFGQVKNYAYWHEFPDAAVPGVYDDYKLTVTVDSSEPTQILFHTQSEEAYYALALFAEGNGLTVFKSENGVKTIITTTTLATINPFMDVHLETKGNFATVQVGGNEPVTFDLSGFSTGTVVLEIGSFTNLLIDAPSARSPITKVDFFLGDALVASTLPDENGFFTHVVDLGSNPPGLVLANGEEFIITVRAHDESENTDESSLSVFYDTLGPDRPILEPLPLEYEDKQYPFRVYNATLFTKNNSLYLSGYTNEPLAALLFSVGKTKTALKTHEFYKQQPTQKIEALGQNPFKTALLVEENSTSFLVTANIPSLVKKGMYISFPSYVRDKYAKYHSFYKIQDITYQQGTGATITLEEPLEQEIPQGEEFEVFTQWYEETWFGQFINLTGGLNYYRIDPYDALMNHGDPTEIEHVFVDPFVPYVVVEYTYPKDGWVLANSSTENRVLIAEFGRGLHPDSIQLFVNGLAASYMIVALQGDVLDNGLGLYEYNLSFEGMQERGQYNFTLVGEDFAGNSFEYNWSYKIDPKAPMPFKVVGLDNLVVIKDGKGNPITDPSGKLYVSDLPESFTLENEDPDSNITIDYVEIIASVHGKKTYINITCDKKGNETNQNIFGCALPTFDELVSQYGLEKDALIEFEVVVHSTRHLADGDIPGVWSFFFVLDKEKPQFEFVSFIDKNITSTKNISLEIKSVNEQNGLFATVVFQNSEDPSETYTATVLLSQAGQSEGAALYTGVIDESLLPKTEPGQDKTFKVTVTVSDYSGNTNTKEKHIIIDNTPPSVSGLKIIAQPVYESEGGNFVVKGDTLKVSIASVSTDVESITLQKVGSSPFFYTKACEQDDDRDCVGNPFFNTSEIASLLTGESKDSTQKVLTNYVNFTFIDKAGNVLALQKIIKKDMGSPVLQQFCLGLPEYGICVGPLVQEVKPLPVKNISVTFDECGSDVGADPSKLACYLKFMKQSCADKSLPFTSSYSECVVSRVVKLQNPDLYPLCDEAKIQANDCYCLLYKVTGVESLMGQITLKNVEEACKESQKKQDHPFNTKKKQYLAAMI